MPRQNVKNLMLRADVVEASKNGMFHIYAAKSVDEGIEILTGVPAGELSPEGTYPEGTVHYRVDSKLRKLARSLQGFYAELVEGASG